jgi:outer membrane protein OmpA-like peptidoglycan-associated protein
MMTEIVWAQESLEQALKNVKAYYTQALEAAAGVFSQSDFEKAHDLLIDAEEAIRDKEISEKILEKINSAVELFKSSIEIAKTQSFKFANLMAIRKNVLSINMGEFLPEQFTDAEEEFINAVEEFNDKDTEGFNKYSILAEKLYKEAELLMIKHKYLQQIKSNLSVAEDNNLEKYAPLTLKKSKQLVIDAENIINSNRYDTLNAKSKVMQALYEINHGQYLKDSFVKMDREDKTLEDMILFWEEPMTNIARELNLPAEFHNGPGEVSSQIIKKIIENKTKLTEANENNKQLNIMLTENKKQISDQKQQNEKLNLQIQELSNQLTDIKNNYDALTKNFQEAQSKLSVLEGENIQFKTQSEEMQKNQKLIESIFTMFLPSEAEILKSGDNIIVRLVNLNFAPNKSTLDPQYYSLLMKVQKAIQTFPNGTAVIEGHTDSQGDYQRNLELSQARAASIYQFLITSMTSDAHKLSVIGLGSSKPIANNNTEEGKAKNRRIEIVINPQFKIK